MQLYTHRNIDLDAVASLWAVRRFVHPQAFIRFVDANWDGSEMCDGDTAVDIFAGNKGIKGKQDPDGTIHSCFATLVSKCCSPEEQQALAELVLYVDATDRGNGPKNLGATGEMAKIWSFTGINAVLRAFQSLHNCDPRKDLNVSLKMFEIFNGLLINGLTRLECVKDADQAEWISPTVVINRHTQRMGTNGVLFERGALAVVFVDGHNMGVVREGQQTTRMDAPAVRQVINGETGWFFHPSGFLVARGTRKAPATSPSNVDPVELAKAVATLI